MADQFYDDIPAVGNEISEDIPKIEKSLGFLKDAFENFVNDWSNTDATSIYPKSIWDADTDTGIQAEESSDEDILRFDTGGTERVTLDSDGFHITAGIGFPATAVSSADANTLDDYEEGTWTPTAADAETGGNTGTTGVGSYTKIGRVVLLQGYASNIDTTGMTAGNNFYFQGVPFTVSAMLPNGSVRLDNVAFDGYVTATIATTSILLKTMTSSATDQNVIVSDVSDGVGDAYFSINYEI